MKKVSILAITALTVMSVVFLASCDNPAGAAAADPLAAATKALEAINKVILPDTTATPPVTTNIEADIDAAIAATPTTSGAAATAKATVEALVTRIAGLEKEAEAAVAATAKIVADEKTYDKTKATALKTAVDKLAVLILGGKDKKAGNADGIEAKTKAITTAIAKTGFDIANQKDSTAINAELVKVKKQLFGGSSASVGDDTAIKYVAAAAVEAVKISGLKK